jgi:AcrR family transcriptional regulator
MNASINTRSPAERKGTQRERLLAGMVTAAARHGYTGANVSQVIANAGVSRPTFYEYFRDKEDCFLAAHRQLGELLVWEIDRAVSARPPERAVQTAVCRLVELAEAFPERAALLVNEAMAGGASALEEHDRLIAAIAAILERAHAKTPASVDSPDLPIHTALGAGRWLLAPALRRGEHNLATLSQEIAHWVEGYLRPSGEHRWRGLEPGPELKPSSHVAPVWLNPPPPIPPGRSKLSKSEIARNQRERIMYATAETVVLTGYNLTTIADITKAAGVDRRVFYKHFRDKQQAFLAVHELGMQQLMAISATAFFSASEWPERVWEATRASTQFEATHPLITQLGHVQSHAVGAPVIQRIDDARAAFTIFLQEGNRYAKAQPSRTAMEAIGGAIFEIAYQQARQDQCERISRLAGHATYLILSPFIGSAAASDFVEAKLSESAL